MRNIILKLYFLLSKPYKKSIKKLIITTVIIANTIANLVKQPIVYKNLLKDFKLFITAVYTKKKGKASKALYNTLVLLIKWTQITIKVFQFRDVHASSKRYIDIKEVESFYLKKTLSKKKKSSISFNTMLLKLIRASLQV